MQDVLELSPRMSGKHMAAIERLDRQFHYLSEGWRGYAWRPQMSLAELYDDAADPGASVMSWAWVALLVLLLACCASRLLRQASYRGE